MIVTDQRLTAAAGSIYCTWIDDSTNKLVTRYDNVDTHKVVSVEYDPHA